MKNLWHLFFGGFHITNDKKNNNIQILSKTWDFNTFHTGPSRVFSSQNFSENYSHALLCLKPCSIILSKIKQAPGLRKINKFVKTIFRSNLSPQERHNPESSREQNTYQRQNDMAQLIFATSRQLRKGSISKRVIRMSVPICLGDKTV